MSKLNAFIAGVKVLDLSQYIPGPLASLLLADMGADVLKIEPPAGDAMQRLGPVDLEGRPIFYRSLNAGKTIRQMDLKRPEIRDEFLHLVADADVLIESFRPGVMTRLGLDYGTLTKINQRLIYCSISSYGAKSTLANFAGHDANYLALTGVLDRNGDEAPIVFDPPIADMSGSLFAVITILGALHGRRATGRGCEIDLALADSVLPLQLLHVAAYGAVGAVPQRRGTYLNGGAAYYQIYRTADERYIMLGAIEPKFWRAFCEAAEHPEWIERQAEPIPQHDLIRDVGVFFGDLSSDACVGRFSSVDCCFSLVLNLAEALESPQIVGRGIVHAEPGGAWQVLFPALVDGELPRARDDVKQRNDERTRHGS